MKKRNTLLLWLYEYRICFCSFLLPFLSMMLIFISSEIFPFGDESFMHSDMYHQYVPFLREFVRKIRDGASWHYSWNIGLGSNYPALFIYYCASPFNWLALLFPTEYLIEFMSYMVVFKIGLAGFTFAFYLKHHFRTDSWLCVFFALFYAMSGFVAAYNWNVMWMDCLFLAPLIILGLEKLVKEKKGALYCVTLTLSILSNYYISIMICLFVCLYFLLLLTEFKKSRSHTAFCTKMIRTVCRFALYSLLAGGMASVLLLPELYALRSSEFTQFNFPDTVKIYFPLFDMIARHATGVLAEAGLDHWPNIFCSSAVFLLLPLYVCNPGIPLRRKAIRLALWAFLLLGFSVNVLNYIWHGFNYPNSLPARQSFLYIFFVLILCFETVHRREKIQRSHFLCAFGFGLGYLFLAEKLIADDAFSSTVFILSMGLVCVYALLLYIFFFGVPALQRCIALTALAVVTFEATYHMSSTSVSTTSRSNYVDPLTAYETLADSARADDPGFYRFEKFSRTTKNDGALANFPTASCFASTANSRAGNWYDRMGLSDSKVFYCFDGQTPFTSALLNVRYMFSTSAAEDPSLYTLVDELDGICLYRCNYTLPAGYVLPDTVNIASADLVGVTDDPLELQNLCGQQLVADSQMFINAPVVNNGKTAYITVLSDGHYYAYSKNSQVNTVKMESDSIDKTFKKVKYDYILDLGWHEAGDQITLTNTDSGALDLTAYSLNPAALSRVLDTLGKTGFYTDSYDTDSLTGHVTLKEPGTLVLSVPYESGWTLRVNGVKAKPEAYDELFCSVRLPAGTHQIQLHFNAPALPAGICISLFSLILFFMYETWRKRQNGLTKKSKRISIKKIKTDSALL